MTALNSVMPAQAGIQVLCEKVAHDLEKAQKSLILQIANPLNADLVQWATFSRLG